MRFVLGILFGLCLFSCSLNYDDESKKENKAPEFIFTNPIFSRYEDNSLSLQIQSSQLERYKNGQIYASNLEFTQLNSDSQIQTKGKCNLFSADQSNGIYLLFDDIELFSKENDANFFANYLKWNANTEQLIGSKRDTVRIEKTDTIIFGTGFSASGISKTYKFNGTVTGSIESKEDTETTQNAMVNE